jgi:hypothetical protein
MKNENNIKTWSVLGKGYENTLNDNYCLPTYTYITKKFAGTEKEFNNFCDNLYNTIECWKEIDRGLSKEPKSFEEFKKEIEQIKLKEKNIKPKYKTQKRYKAPNFEDSFKKENKPFRYIG